MSETDNDNNTTPGADGQEGLRPPDVFDDEKLLSPPVRRAAYSDRTAWLMAAMSELAYFRFEGGEDFKSLALDLIRITSPGDVEDRLKRFLRQMNAGTTEGRNALKATLKAAGFELVNVYNVADTQAFLARKPATSAADGMRILAFRGTESDKWRDIKTDVDAILVHPEDGLVSEQIHSGFYKAFCGIRKKIEKDLEKDPHLPLYVTGHSLGGALAIVATRFIAADSLGACYTFGAPRVGNVHMGQVFKTPIYRVVNAADAVPRLPPVHVTPLLIALFKLLH